MIYFVCLFYYHIHMKIVFLDADGTLFHSDGYVPLSSLEACQRAQEKGHLICLCTGRQRTEIYGDMTKINYDALICGAGSYIEVNNDILFETTFSNTQMDMLQNYFDTYSIPALYESSNHIVATSDTYQKLDSMQPKEDGLVQLIDSVHIVDAPFTYPINKITFLSSNRAYDDIVSDLGPLFEVVPCTFEPLGKDSGEIARKDITKGTGIQMVLELFKDQIHESISIGDNYNDIPMFQVTDTSIAMGNAPKDIQEVVDHVTTSIDEDGIYKAFQHLHII